MSQATQSVSDFMGDNQSVHMFGAVGDGVTDDTAAIQASISATPSGGRIHFPRPVSGYYKISAGLLFTGLNGITVTGDAGTELRYAALATDTPNTSWPNFGLGSNLRFVDCSNVVIDGLIVNGNLSNRIAHGTSTYSTGTLAATNGSGALVGSGTTWTSGMVNGGILIGSAVYTITGFTNATHITVSPVFGQTTASGLAYSITYSASESENSCILLAGCANVTVRGCLIKESMTDGVFVGADSTGTLSTNIWIIDSTIQACRRNNVSGVGHDGLWIRGNRIKDAGTIQGAAPMSNIDIEPDTTTQQSFNVHIEGNTITGAAGTYAVSCVGTAGLTVADNQIHDNAGYGANFEAQSTGGTFANTDAVLSGGAIYNNGSIGLRVVQRNLVSVRDVEFRNNIQGVQCYLADGLIVDGCIFDSNLNGGFSAFSTTGYDTSLGFLNLAVQNCHFRNNFSAAGIANGALGWSIQATPAGGSSQLLVEECWFYGTQNPITSTSPQSVSVTAVCLFRTNDNTAFLLANPLNQFGLGATGTGNWNYDLQGVYAVGSVAATNGSGAIVGTGTTWTSAMVGAEVYFDGFSARVTVFTDATHLTMSPVFSPSSASGLGYLLLGFGAYQQYAGGNTTDGTITVCTQSTFPTLSGLSPGFIYVSDYGHMIYWNGSTPVFTDGGSDYYSLGQHASGTFGWHACDGSTVPFLNPDGTLGSKVLVNTGGVGYSAEFLQVGIGLDVLTSAINPTITSGGTTGGKTGTDFSAVLPTLGSSSPGAPPSFYTQLWYRQ